MADSKISALTAATSLADADEFVLAVSGASKKIAASSLRDQAAAISSMRTLGTGAAAACAGNDSRLSDSRAPSGSAGGDLSGTYPNPTVAQIAAAPSHLTLPVTTSAESTEGRARLDSTTLALSVYDSQRERVIGDVGWAPYAFPPGYYNGATVNTNLALPLSGGAVAMPIQVIGHMLLQNVILRNNDTATLRAAEWRLFVQYLNNGNSGENTLAEVTGANGTFSFTPSAASTRTSPASGAPVYLPPGMYWLVLRNTDGTSAFTLACAATGTIQPDLMQTKTLSSGLTTTLDFVAATWAKSALSPAVLLQGRVFGQTAAF